MTPVRRVESYGEERTPHRCSCDAACRHPGAGAWGEVWVPFGAWAALAGWPDDDDLACLARVSRRTIVRWRARDAIPWRNADRCAVALGLHASNVWLEWFATPTSTAQGSSETISA